MIRFVKRQGGIRPLIRLFAGLEHTHVTAIRTFERISKQVGLKFGWFVCIIWVEQHLREEVGDLLRNAIRTHHSILKAILFTRLEPSERNPKERAILRMTYILKQYPDDVMEHLKISQTTYYRLRKHATEEIDIFLNARNNWE